MEPDGQSFQQLRTMSRSENGTTATAAGGGSNYSLRKPIQNPSIEYDDDDDITPYATFTLKTIQGMDTSRSLMSAPTIRASGGGYSDSYSTNSIEGISQYKCWYCSSPNSLSCLVVYLEKYELFMHHYSSIHLLVST